MGILCPSKEKYSLQSMKQAENVYMVWHFRINVCQRYRQRLTTTEPNYHEYIRCGSSVNHMSSARCCWNSTPGRLRIMDWHSLSIIVWRTLFLGKHVIQTLIRGSESYKVILFNLVCMNNGNHAKRSVTLIESMLKTSSIFLTISHSLHLPLSQPEWWMSVDR